MIKIDVYGLRLLARVLLLVVVCLAFGWVFWDPNWIFTQIILGVITVLISIEIYRYLQKTNRELIRLLEALRHEEFSVSFGENRLGKRYSELNKLMGEIVSEYSIKTENNQNTLRLYQRILDSLEYGILLFDNDETIVIQSPQFSNLLNIPRIKTIEDLESTVHGFVSQVKTASDNASVFLKPEDFGHNFNHDLSCRIQKFRSNGERMTLLILSTSRAVLESDYESWVNFSKVISHEILNGISPLISLTTKMQDQVSHVQGNEKLKESMQKALKIIEERTQSLQDYSERYRTLHKLPEPNFESLQWSSVIEKNIDLHEKDLAQYKIEVAITGQALEDTFSADRWHMDQVFSNLIANSVHSLKVKNEGPRMIYINVDSNRLHYLIQFSDNGSGIGKDNRAKVFAPFFTTRESGSGIGLSVVRQILWKHNAEIFLNDNEEGASFMIRFPKL